MPVPSRQKMNGQKPKTANGSRRAPPSARQTRNKITIFDYDAAHVKELATWGIADAVKFKDQPTVTWINIDNVPPAEFLEELGLGFALHPVILDNIESVNERPKVEPLDDYIYLVFKMLTLDETKRRIESEQVSLVLAAKFVITFQQGKTGDTFEPVRRLIRKSGTRTRSAGTDYLTYELMDSVVNGYFEILEHFGDKIENLESEVLRAPTSRTARGIHHLKREILQLRKAVWPLREVVNVLERGDLPLIKKSTRIYLRDLYDRVVQVVDTIETYRDMLTGMLDLYLSGTSNKTNAVMKVLTIITTIFMPLSLLAGIYGMNFEHMPGQDSPYGFAGVLSGMAVTLLVMVYYFRRKQWL